MEWLQKVVDALLAPLITAVLAALGLWLSERGKTRSAAHTRRLALTDENARVAYLKLWLEADGLVGDTGNGDAKREREEVRRQLSASRDRLNKIDLSKPRDEDPSALIRAWRRAALVPLTRTAARAVRWVYWCVIILGLTFVLGLMFTNINEFDPFVNIFGTAIISLPLLPVALLLAFWAKHLERHRNQAPVPAPSSPEWRAASWHQTGPPNYTQPRMLNDPPQGQ